MNKRITQLYNDPATPGSLGGLGKMFKEFKKFIPDLTMKRLKEWTKTHVGYSLHRPSRKSFLRERILTGTIDYLWEADLVDMSQLKEENDGVTFLLVCIDTFSKYLWVRTLKRKTGTEIIKAFESIINEGRQPKKLRTDKGTEFINKQFQALLKAKGISFYTASNEPKAAIVERVNRTLKTKMYRYFTVANTRRYIEVLQQLVDSYNNTYHRSIRMRPSKVGLNNVGIVRRNLFGNQPVKKKVKYKVGDYVRLSLRKRIFGKGYLENFTEEVFKVNKVFSRNTPTTYGVEDLKGEEIEGRFYGKELQLVDLPETFVIEKIIRRRKSREGKNMYLVRWRGYPPEFDEWVGEDQVQTI